MAGFETLEEHRQFGGTQGVYRHSSAETGCAMTFAVYIPEGPGPWPVLTYLSGLTCTHANVMDKGGAQRCCAEHGIALVMPDTSPRGLNLPGEDAAHDFGTGAGFYLDATEEPWVKNYRMYAYITEELPKVIEDGFPVDAGRAGIFGHSMGGHGALIIALKNPSRYRSLSAFAPIASPTRCPWGEKALGGYLGPDRGAWAAYDACLLAHGSGWSSPVLVDQGGADSFLEEQLKPGLLREAFDAAGIPLHLRRQEGYDHSYAFISTFMGDHIAHHARLLEV